MKNPLGISTANLLQMTEIATSLDELLGGRVRLIQPQGGLRAAIDPVLLAAAIPAKSGEQVLDAGCGTGAAALCLAARVAGVRVVGLDLQADLVALALESASLNAMSGRIAFFAGDILAPPPQIAETQFDHVMANPPYMRAGSGHVSPDRSRALASVEGAADLASWVRFCVGRTQPGGSVTFIHRADRAAEVAALLVAAGADAAICPLGPKRALIQGIAAGAGSAIPSVCHLPGLTLHEADRAFSAGAEAILRHGQGLVITPR